MIRHRILAGFLLLGLFLLTGGLLYRSWSSLDEEQQGHGPLHEGAAALEARIPGDSRKEGSPSASLEPYASKTGTLAMSPGSLQENDSAADGHQDMAADEAGDSAPDSPEEEVPVALPPSVFNALNHSDLKDIPREGIEGIAQEFVDKVKQGGWDNTSEAYRKNWEKAAEEADEAIRAAYGYDAFLKLSGSGKD